MRYKSRMNTTVVSLDEIKKRFEAENEAQMFGWFTDQLGYIQERAERKQKPTELHLAKGPIHLDTLKPNSPWILVIDGDLDVSGDIDLSTEPYDMSLFVVFGNVRAKNFRFSGSACCFVSKSLELSGGCFGDHGDESAELHCAKLTARVLVLDGHTGVNAAELNTVVFASEGWGLPRHFTENDNAADFFVVDVLTDDGIHEEEVWNLMTSGRDPFLPGAYEKLRARVVDGKARQKPQ
jgi:hypothetical protein